MIAIIDGCGANINSIQFALARLGAEFQVTKDKEKINAASHVILSGVGSANAAMENLSRDNLIPLIKNLKQPVLGICLGMQLLFDTSEENNTEMLGIIPGEVKALPKSVEYKIPHMGWNNLQKIKKNKLLRGINQKSFFYFVHGFAVEQTDSALAYSNYSKDFVSVVGQDNFFGVQFHPEKSAQSGKKLLSNFLRMK